MTNTKSFLLFFFFIFLNLFAFADEIKPDLSPEIKKILRKNGLKNETLRFSFKNLDKADEIHSYQSNQPFIPASITKIFTAVYALQRLGADFQFQTQLSYTGKIEGDTLKGDLFLVGSGDPSLTMARLMDLCMDLRQKGIKKVQGNFFYDDSALPTILELSNFGNGDQTYNPGLSALNLEYNRITLYRDGNRKTKGANFIPMPPMIHMHIEKTKESFPLGTRYRFRKEAGGEVWEVSEKQKYNIYEDIPVRRPSRRTAETFRTLSELWGISLPPSRQGKLPSSSQLLGIDKSPPLLRLLSLTLEYSNNLFAEQILLKSTDKKTIPEAAKTISTWLSKNISSCKLPLVNGSGLTSEHKLTSDCLVDFLDKFALSPVAKRGFMSLLSINGQSGWLRKRLRHPDTNFRIWAKTGSLDYIANLAGVLFSLSGKRYAFSLSISNDDSRGLIDEAISHEAEGKPHKLGRKTLRLKKRAPTWGRKAKNTADELLKHFIQTL